LLQQKHGSFLHITSSSSPSPDNSWKAAFNVMLYADAPLNFNRYEAEDAARTNSAVIGNDHASSRRFVRIAAAPYGKVHFDIYREHGGNQTVRLRYTDMGIPASPHVTVNGTPVVVIGTQSDGDSGWSFMDVKATWRDGDNTIDVNGDNYVYDLDYIEIEPVR
jgi:hypothetical protein